jgi:hypothetical protein
MLLCAVPNRKKGATPDPAQWPAQSRFDEEFNYDKLRPSQKENMKNVFYCDDLFTNHLRKRLLNHVSLLSLTCGAGKTVLMLAYLYAICAEVNKRLVAGPRPCKVLWFTYQTGLCVQLKNDIKHDVIRHRLAPTVPSMRICSETGDLDKLPGQHDITISCPNALWESKSQHRSDADIALILAEYDVIVWDECDFARNQIERLVRLSPHALKFGITAAPIDANGNFVGHPFVIAGSASHTTVFNNDKCLAPMLSWDEASDFGYIKPIRHAGHGKFSAGVEQLSPGSHNVKYSLPGSMSAIRQAIGDILALESQMKNEWPDHWFSPHMFVPCSTADEAIELHKQTTHDMQLMGLSPDDGWLSTVTVSSKKGRKEPHETGFFHENSDLVHPFMRALTNKGRCSHGCSRIAFVVDIGLRGMNHWACKFITDIKRSNSWSEQLQTIGRTSRLPLHLQDKVDDKSFNLFCHPRLYYPDYTASDDVQCNPGAHDAWTFIVEMDERLERSGLPSWPELLAGEITYTEEQPDDAATPFTMVDQLLVDTALGERIARGEPITDDAIDAIIDTLPQSDDWKTTAKNHARRVRDDAEYRNRQVRPSFEVIQPISREEPKNPEDYTIGELSEFIIRSPLIENEYISQLDHPSIRKLIGKFKHQEDRPHFRPVTKIRQLQAADGRPGVLTDIRNSIQRELLEKGLWYKRLWTSLSKEVNNQFANLCGIAKNAINPCENDSLLDRAHYHYQLSIPSVRRKLKDMVIGELILKGHLGAAKYLYTNE